jgi:phytoene/squalene synthetase
MKGGRGGDARAQYLVRRALDVEVDEVERPLRRHERRERKEPERREGGFRPDHRHDVAVAPERAVRELGVEEQSFHGAAGHRWDASLG